MKRIVLGIAITFVLTLPACGAEVGAPEPRDRNSRRWSSTHFIRLPEANVDPYFRHRLRHLV
ncbi:hypothetical protein O4214_20420 [Rhodococcus erythropolis]|uniref:hypothetical protein n=1 Tax=Rhodococcus erythropolis TaxID=1833 RepID=UPI001E4F47CE|nr:MULTISPECIES: hypothetical protein [Rhodococcus erythropolis group]MCD2104983.1 hypothetical protein [Rhodococcus qingshengii]MCZ4526356.1 hypothetical protein [Rhodococcus erythropolis]